jgi:hypothetical protein
MNSIRPQVHAPSGMLLADLVFVPFTPVGLPLSLSIYSAKP